MLVLWVLEETWHLEVVHDLLEVLLHPGMRRVRRGRRRRNATHGWQDSKC